MVGFYLALVSIQLPAATASGHPKKVCFLSSGGTDGHPVGQPENIFILYFFNLFFFKYLSKENNRGGGGGKKNPENIKNIHPLGTFKFTRAVDRKHLFLKVASLTAGHRLNAGFPQTSKTRAMYKYI